MYALGPVAGRLPDGGFGYIDNMSPERVEAQGEGGDTHMYTCTRTHTPTHMHMHILYVTYSLHAACAWVLCLLGCCS